MLESYQGGITNMIKIHLSKLLGERRWTQADLVRHTKICPTTINEMYHEMIDRVAVEHLDKICEALGCKISELLEYVPSERITTGGRCLSKGAQTTHRR